MSASDKVALDGMPLYIQSRNANLITNGTALQGTNYNFTDFVLDQQEVPSLPGSFSVEGYAGGGTPSVGQVFNDEFIPVDPAKIYEISFLVKQYGVPGDWTAYTKGNRHLFYAGVACYDVDLKFISPINYLQNLAYGDTHTTLAADINNGDTTVYLTDATNWDNVGPQTYKFGLHRLDYTNSFGHLYTDYTRNLTAHAWDAGGIDYVANTIALRVAWAGGTIPAGTPVYNGYTSGGWGYHTMLAQVPPTTDEWYVARGWIGGVNRGGMLSNLNFPPGTAYGRLFFFPFYSNRPGGWSIYPDTGPTQKAWYAGFSMTARLDAMKLKQADGRYHIYIPEPSVVAPGDATGTITLTKKVRPDNLVLAVV